MNEKMNKLKVRINCKSQLTPDLRVKFKINAKVFAWENKVMLH